MDVHPTKNVSIGIDPYPYGGFVGSIQLHQRLAVRLGSGCLPQAGNYGPEPNVRFEMVAKSVKLKIFSIIVPWLLEKKQTIIMIQHDPTSLYIKITTLIHLEYKRCDVWVEQVTWL